MKHGMLTLGVLLLLGIVLASADTALAGPPVQAATPSAQAQATAVPTAIKAPANLVGREPNEADGFFPAVCLGTGLIFAGIGAFVAASRDERKARRLRKRAAAGGG